MTKVYSFKSGHIYTAPSLFVNPQSPIDVKALWETDSKYGLPNIDGLYLRFVDYNDVYKNLGYKDKPLFESERATIREKILLIDPSLDHLLSGMFADKIKILDIGIFDNKLKKLLSEIALSDVSQVEKIKKTIEEVYPQLNSRRLIEFQLDNGASAIISPCVNLSSTIFLQQQIKKAREMLMNARTLLETTFKKYLETRDLMNVVSISKSIILHERNFKTIFDLLLCNNPDHVGIKFHGLRETDSYAYSKVFQFYRQFVEYSSHVSSKQPSIHFINVDEIGYVGYCNGISNIISPIAKSPQFAFRRRKIKGGGASRPSTTATTEEHDTSPTFYHPIDMNYQPLKSFDIIPDSCGECKKWKNVSNIPYNQRPLFRRIHWLNTKDNEIREFRETPVRLNFSLRDKLARSMRTQLVAYLPEQPVFTIY
jgi:hypothetical protein